MSLKRTPLYHTHAALSAQLVDFGGWEMPVRYTSDIAEHMAVRTHVGVFDVSHMGEIRLKGKRALDAVNMLLTNDIDTIENGQAMYACMLKHDGGILDDVVAYRFSEEDVLLCVNASNQEKDFNWIQSVVSKHFHKDDVTAANESNDFAQIAIQGPHAARLVSLIYGDVVKDIDRFHFIEKAGHVIARTGYTGEDGFEIFTASSQIEALWRRVFEADATNPPLPCGLAARDTLRLEAGMCLYGNDIDESTTPIEAALSWTVKYEKRVPFIGQDALVEQKAKGIKRRLVGLKLSDRNIPRRGYQVYGESGPIGHVTSGTLAPYLKYPIAMAYIQKPYNEAGNKVFVEIRQKKAEAIVVTLPFYKRERNMP